MCMCIYAMRSNRAAATKHTMRMAAAATQQQPTMQQQPCSSNVGSCLSAHCKLCLHEISALK